MTTPRFAVVGHPNKGKSSIVSTLAQDDSIYIDRVSGSTRVSHSYPMTVNGEVLYVLIDTPGFQRARAALEWLQQHSSNASQRAEAVRAFCAQHQGQESFVNECELLQPIVDGAGIIYVVDGSRPYGPEYEAEMEILRWTGRPSLALINPIDSNDYVNEWEHALGQYFKTVRVFDAHRAEFIKRTALLSVFGQMLPEWETALTRAVSCLVAERERQHRQASELIATMMVTILQHREIQNIGLGLTGDGIKEAMAEKLLEHIPIFRQWQETEKPSNNIRNAMLKLGPSWDVPQKIRRKKRPYPDVAQELDERMRKKVEEVLGSCQACHTHAGRPEQVVNNRTQSRNPNG